MRQNGSEPDQQLRRRRTAHLEMERRLHRPRAPFVRGEGGIGVGYLREVPGEDGGHREPYWTVWDGLSGGIILEQPIAVRFLPDFKVLQTLRTIRQCVSPGYGAIEKLMSTNRLDVKFRKHVAWSRSRIGQ